MPNTISAMPHIIKKRDCPFVGSENAGCFRRLRVSIMEIGSAGRAAGTITCAASPSFGG